MAQSDDVDVHAPGWDAIDSAMRKLYGNQEPQHWAAVVPAFLGGPDPLQGVSAFRADAALPHWHYVTYGFTELYQKEWKDSEYSGFGFELTFRLARGDSIEAPVWPVVLLQNLARYIFETGRFFAPGQHTTLNGPIALDEKTDIWAALFVQDPQLPPISSHNGRFEFVQLVGITEDEYSATRAWNTDGMAKLLAERDPLLVTDISRRSILEDPRTAELIREKGRQEGSSCGTIFCTNVAWQAGEQLAITLGANVIGDIGLILPNRVSHGLGLLLAGKEQTVAIEPGKELFWEAEGNTLTLAIPTAAALELAVAIRPKRGRYAIAAMPGVVVEVAQHEIVDRDGKPVRVIG
jgi:suppressor of fused